MRTYERRIRALSRDDVRCFRCDEPIARGELAIESTLWLPYELADAEDPDTPTTAWQHPDCSLDVALSETTTVLQKFKPRDAALEAVYQRGLARRRAANEISRARAGEGKISEKTMARVEQSVDRKGRPRVAVVAIGSGASPTSWTWTSFEATAHDGTIASPLREYGFVTFSAQMTEYVATDPSQPLAAAVFVSIAATKIVKAQREKLVAVRTLGVPTPVLWLIGPECRDSKARDTKVLELRAELDRVGFQGDDALVLCSERVDEGSLRELVSTLDALENKQRSPRTQRESLDNAVTALEIAVRDRAAEQYAPLFANCVRLLPRGETLRADDPIRVRSHAAARVCISDSAARASVLAYYDATGNAADKESVVTCMRDMFNDPGRGLAKEFSQAYALLAKWKLSSRDAVVVEGVLHPASSKLRRDALYALLTNATSAALAATLREAAAALKDKDPRKLEYQSAASLIEARAAAANESATDEEPAT